MFWFSWNDFLVFRFFVLVLEFVPDPPHLSGIAGPGANGEEAVRSHRAALALLVVVEYLPPGGFRLAVHADHAAAYGPNGEIKASKILVVIDRRGIGLFRV